MSEGRYRFWFGAGAAWEVLRLGVVLWLLLGVWPWPDAQAAVAVSAAIMFVSAGQLLVPAVYVLLTLRGAGSESSDLMNLLRVGKVLAFASGLVMLFAGPQLSDPGLLVPVTVVLDVIVGLDLLALLVLLLLIPQPEPASEAPQAPLPDYEETEVSPEEPGRST